MEWLVNAAATGRDSRDEASKRAGDHLVDMMCDPTLPQEARQSLTTCAATLVRLHDDEPRKRIVDHVPLELVYLVAGSEGPAERSAAKVLEDTFRPWEQMGTTARVSIHAKNRMVSEIEIDAAAQRFGMDIDVRSLEQHTERDERSLDQGGERSNRTVVLNDHGHFYAMIPCMHEGRKTFLTVDPNRNTGARSHAGWVVYGLAQDNTPNACGPIVLDLLRCLQRGESPQAGGGAALPELGELRAQVQDHFDGWNSKEPEGQQWSVAGIRATMLAEAAIPVLELNLPHVTEAPRSRL